jgi:ParB family transcriptional regulator, chromosome partitioning protein
MLIELLARVVLRDDEMADGNVAQLDQYEIIDGERRWRAAQAAAVETIPALVKVRPSVPGDDLLDAMLANGLGIALDVLEEALGY